MNTPALLPKFSIGLGDRFGREAAAQISACVEARRRGVAVVPVWNKSHREHAIIGSSPEETRAQADEAVKALAWPLPYFVDADHITLDTVDRFLPVCDFFTLDVADQIGEPAAQSHLHHFVQSHAELCRPVSLPGSNGALHLDAPSVAHSAERYLAAVQAAGRIYRHIAAANPRLGFVTELSIDETDAPQTTADLLVILAAAADEGIPLQTIAPKFSGRFNKGVDYVGDVHAFAREFTRHLAAIRFALDHYHLPPSLKLSIHSGSDKFSLFPLIHAAIAESDAGLHLKTAGTTWLEELIGIAESGGPGLDIVKDIYGEAFRHRHELAQPYRAVISIDEANLPAPAEVAGWTASAFIAALRHDPRCSAYNNDLRQLLHIAFKIAARMGTRFLDALSVARNETARNVAANLYDRHIAPVFLGKAAE